MSAYLTNLLSRSVDKPAVQPRLNPLLGPATAGPEWTLGQGVESVEEEVHSQESILTTPGTSASRESGEGQQPHDIPTRTSPAPIFPPNADSQSTAPLKRHDASPGSNVRPAMPITPRLPHNPVRSELVSDTHSHPALAPRTIVPSAARRQDEVKLPGITQGQPAPQLQRESAMPPASVETPASSHVQTLRSPAVKAVPSRQRSEHRDATVERAPTQDSQIPAFRSRPQPALSDRIEGTVRDQIQTLMPDFGKPVDRRTLEAEIGFAVPRKRPVEPEHSHSMLPHPSPEPTIAVTIGRIEVRAVTPSQPTKSTPPAAPVMSLDEYLRRRSGRS